MNSSWATVILIIIVAIVVVVFYLRKSNRLPFWLSNIPIFSSPHTIQKLSQLTTKEQERTAELQSILKAKQALEHTKAVNDALRREIGHTSHSNITIPKQSLLESQNERKEKE